MRELVVVAVLALLVGTVAGFVICAILTAGKQADEAEERIADRRPRGLARGRIRLVSAHTTHRGHPC